MSETGDQFAGTSERNTKHNPRLDEELEHEMQGMLRAERSTRVEEWRELVRRALAVDPAAQFAAGYLMAHLAVTARSAHKQLRRLAKAEPYWT